MLSKNLSLLTEGFIRYGLKNYEYYFLRLLILIKSEPSAPKFASLSALVLPSL